MLHIFSAISVLDEVKQEIIRYTRNTSEQLDQFAEKCPGEYFQAEVMSLRRQMPLLVNEAFHLANQIKTLDDKMV